MPNSATLLQALGAAFCAILCALSGMGGGGMMIGARTAAWAKSGGGFVPKYEDGTVFEIELIEGDDLNVTLACRSEIVSNSWVNFGVDMGDGTEYVANISNISHTYERPGRYVVQIEGKARRVSLGITCSGNIIGQYITNIIRLSDALTSLSQIMDLHNHANRLNCILPKWPGNCVNVYYAYRNCKGFTGVFSEDENLLMPSRITNHTGCVTNCSSDIMSKFRSDWGGTKT